AANRGAHGSPAGSGRTPEVATGRARVAQGCWACSLWIAQGHNNHRLCWGWSFETPEEHWMHRPAVASLWRFTRSIALSVALLTGSAAAPSHQEPDIQQAWSTATVVANHRLSVASSTATYGQNLVTNGSFEDGTVGWTVNSPDVATLAVASGYSGTG